MATFRNNTRWLGGIPRLAFLSCPDSGAHKDEFCDYVDTVKWILHTYLDHKT